MARSAPALALMMAADGPANGRVRNTRMPILQLIRAREAPGRHHQAALLLG